MHHKFYAPIALMPVIAFFPGRSLGASAPPPTPMHAVTNVYHGTSVIDHYQWLENFTDPAVKKWNAEQNKVSRAYLDSLPAKNLIAERLKYLSSAASADYSALQSRPGVLFAMKFKSPAQQPWLITLKSADDPASEQVVLDPNKLNPKGTTAIDFAVPSRLGERVAVSLSENGSEDGTLFFYEVKTGQRLPDKIPRVQYPTAGGSVAWNADASGVYYTRYPDPGQRPASDEHFYQQVYFHQLGTPVAQDHYELGQEFPRIAEIQLDSSQDGRYLLATVANGDGGEYAHYLRGPQGAWKQLTRFSDQIKEGQFSKDGPGKDAMLFLLSRQDAPRGKILKLPLPTPSLDRAQVLVPQTESVIEGLCPALGSLYVDYLAGGPSQIRSLGLFGTLPVAVPLMPVSAVEGMVSPAGDELLFRNVSYIHPYVWTKFDPRSGQSTPTALAGISGADFSHVEVVREFALSKDGTKVPLNIIRPKGIKLDGNNPTLLYGYGGYGISLSPDFSAARSVWLDQGGVYVLANLRGGGEFGQQWHQAGNLTRKQNVFDDFAACAKYLIDSKYTRPAKLAVEGASNGGLLMGAFLTQHPDLVRAVVSHVGIYDSLRSELEPNGAFNVTEFGTVNDPAQFKALYAYSPYHHVSDGTRYPAVLLMTGDNDGRVNPFHSRKMAARLQAANRSPSPILLRTTAVAGHGIGTGLNERIAEEADADAFLFDQLGIGYQPR